MLYMCSTSISDSTDRILLTKRDLLSWTTHKGTIGAGTQIGPLEEELVDELLSEEDEEQDRFIFLIGNKYKKGITLEK